MSKESEFNPRYVAYAAVHGKEPNAMMEHDRERYPGGCMTGFITWIPQQWLEWAKSVGRRDLAMLSDAEHDAFTDWLVFGAWLK
jgi:hypothetical protein